MRVFVTAIMVLMLAGCAKTYVVQQYSMDADNVMALKNIEQKGIQITNFAAYPNFKNACRGGKAIRLPEGQTFNGYIKDALSDELKFSGLYDAGDNPRVLISGKLDNLYYTTTKNMTGGEWLIELSLVSSNGNKASVKYLHEFKAGFNGNGACKNTAHHFTVAVQKMINQLVTSSDFITLVK